MTALVEPPSKTSRYRPSPYLIASAIAHLTAITGMIVRPHLWPYLLGAMVLDHAGLAVAGLLPRSRLLGPNVVTLPGDAAARGEVAVTLDDGPDPEVTPRVLDVLDSYDARASFFAVGRRVRTCPEITSEIVARGHTVENHTWSHPNGFVFLPPSALAAQIDRAQREIRTVTGSQPKYFRAPAGIRSPWLEPFLHDRGLRLTSWTRRGFDTVSRQPSRVIGRLLTGIAPGDILLLHDGSGSVDPEGTRMILSVLPELLSEIRTRGWSVVALP